MSHSDESISSDRPTNTTTKKQHILVASKLTLRAMRQRRICRSHAFRRRPVCFLSHRTHDVYTTTMNNFAELLILEVQKRPVLWNKCIQNSTNRLLVDKEWENVAMLLKRDSKSFESIRTPHIYLFQSNFSH